MARQRRIGDIDKRKARRVRREQSGHKPKSNWEEPKSRDGVSANLSNHATNPRARRKTRNGERLMANNWGQA